MQLNRIDPILIEQVVCIADVYTMQSKAELTLVYVLEGEGVTHFEDQAIPFQQGKLFLIPFDAKYSFDSMKRSRFLVVACPQSFITQIRLEADRIETCDNLTKLSYITHNYHAKAGCVFRIAEDGVLAEQLLYAMEREAQNPIQDYLIIRQAMGILLNLVARNLIQSDYNSTAEKQKVRDVMKVITYIQQHIADRDKLSIASLAQEFGMAKSYIGAYFKKQVGLSLQDYMLDYKLKLAEIRLKYSTMRLKEIAFELDFNDESHFSKLFKKYKGMTPSQYRNKQKDA